MKQYLNTFDKKETIREEKQVKLYQTVKRLDHTSRILGPIAFVPAIIIFLVVVHNLVESTIVSPNNLNNVLLSIAAAMAIRANRASQES